MHNIVKTNIVLLQRDFLLRIILIFAVRNAQIKTIADKKLQRAKQTKALNSLKTMMLFINLKNTDKND